MKGIRVIGVVGLLVISAPLFADRSGSSQRSAPNSGLSLPSSLFNGCWYNCSETSWSWDRSQIVIRCASVPQTSAAPDRPGVSCGTLRVPSLGSGDVPAGSPDPAVPFPNLLDVVRADVPESTEDTLRLWRSHW